MTISDVFAAALDILGAEAIRLAAFAWAVILPTIELLYVVGYLT